jgi:hypothetical protein
MSGLVIKCTALIVMIHGFRILGRLAGPRWSALALGLPSTTAFVLFLCGCERGTAAATEMAGSSLLGVAAAVALPLVYAQAVRFGWKLPGALAAAVTGYLAVASTLGALPSPGAVSRIGLAFLAIVLAAWWARRLPLPEENRPSGSLSPGGAMVVRTAIPAVYVMVFALVERLAGPSWAGLVSTFPSMSLVVLAVTHLETGPAEASRIARLLPLGNSSTLAFLTSFYLMSTPIGLSGATLAGYAAALAALALIERHSQIVSMVHILSADIIATWRSYYVPAWRALEDECGVRALALTARHPRAPRYLVHRRPRDCGRFAPRVETLAW